MAERLAFLLGKDPATSHGGDMTMFRTMHAIAAERFETEVICLSEQPTYDEADVVRVRKPTLSLPSLVARSMVQRRSLLHTRFDVDGLRVAVEKSPADRFVALHCHLAESYLLADGVRPAEELLVSTEILESKIWPLTHGLAGRFESRRLRRDEERIVAAARALAGYDRDDMARYRASGLDAHWLPMTLPPAPPVDVAATPPRIVMLGNRLWRPNANAADTMVRLWPRIAARIPGAELCLVGEPPARSTLDLPQGVTDLGMVEDVDDILSRSRALTAPVAVGGGVRVKLLEAAARGIPVVCSTEAVGSIEAAIGMAPASDEDDFVSHCRAFLLDADLAAQEGARLHDINERRWSDRIAQDAVLGWLSA
jgi:glycosyltransferase involved in cell wall biosynthesis